MTVHIPLSANGVTDPVAHDIAEPAAPAPEPFDVEAAIASIPNVFWLTARRKLDMTTDEIVGDGVALSIVLAVRRSISETGVPDWDKWLNATQDETNDYLGIDLVDDTKSD